MLKYTKNPILRVYRFYEIIPTSSTSSLILNRQQCSNTNKVHLLIPRRKISFNNIKSHHNSSVSSFSSLHSNYHNNNVAATITTLQLIPPRLKYLNLLDSWRLNQTRALHSTSVQRDGESSSSNSKPSSSNSKPSSSNSKPSSKVEETAKIYTEEYKVKQEGTAVEKPKRPLYKRIQDEILHYYHGFKLLFIDINITRKLIWRILNGKTLSRREHKQLIRTTSDVFRLVPFSVFVIVPFMELLLPVFLKFFPGMLPSTFQTTSDRDTKMKGELKVKLEMAKFLQHTLDEMAPQAKGRSSETAKEFAGFINKIRVSGSEVSNADIMKFSKLFEDEITLDSLSRPQLIALCRLLEIPAYGTTAILRFQLRMRLRSLAADDRMIEKEGVSALNLRELQTACKSRGMRAVGVTEERLQRQLEQWLQLSLHEKVPPSLLLLSRAMYLPDNLPASAQLQATLSALPEAAALQTKAAIGEREGKVDNKTRIELIKEEERKIKEEQQESDTKKITTETEEKAKKKIKAAPEVIKTEPPPTVDQPVITSSSAELKPKTKDVKPAEPAPKYQPTPMVSELGPEKPFSYTHDPLSVIGAINSVLSRKYIKPMLDTEDNLTTKDFEAIEDAIEKLGNERKEMLIEKEELQDLKEEMADYTEDLKLLENVVKQSGTKELKVNKGAKRLFNRLNSMISEMEKIVGGDKKPTIPGLENTVATEELIAVMRHIQTVEGDPAKVNRIARLLSKLDDNKDGKIEIDDVVKVIEIVGRENMNMTSKQLEEIVSILAKEETLGHKKPNTDK